MYTQEEKQMKKNNRNAWSGAKHIVPKGPKDVQDTFTTFAHLERDGNGVITCPHCNTHGSVVQASKEYHCKNCGRYFNEGQLDTTWSKEGSIDKGSCGNNLNKIGR